MKKWRCKVCGYIHEGDAPPEVCPVCQVGPEEFEEVLEKAPAAAKNVSKRWKCTVCDYIHKGEQPPKKCPVCGVGPEFFVLLANAVEKQLLTTEAVLEADSAAAFAALDKISYGLYVVSSFAAGKLNGQCANTVFQLTSKPPVIAICLNNRNLTHEFVHKSLVFAVSILGQEQVDMARRFGYSSGRNMDKFTEVPYVLGKNGCPILRECLGYLECRVMPEKIMDVGTHTLFVAEVLSGKVLAEDPALTYSEYRTKK